MKQADGTSQFLLGIIITIITFITIISIITLLSLVHH